MSLIPAEDLALQRSHPQTSDMYLVIQQPQRFTESAYVANQEWVDYDWYCRVDGDPLGDPIATLVVDGGGPAATLLGGMTVLIGSAYGEWDKAIVRLRGDQVVGAGTVALDIATSSDIAGIVKDNDYIVVLDEFRLWQIFGRIEVAGDVVTWYKDYSILWDDLGANDAARRLASMPPVPIMGPHAVKFIETPEVNSQFWFDWQDSYATAPAETVATWTSEGEQDHAGNTWNSAAESPGWQQFLGISGLRGFRITLEVDDGNGNATTLPYRRGIRYVFTLRRPGESQAGDPANAEPIIHFRINSSPRGSFSQGYWRTSLTVFGEDATRYMIIPGALVILFTDDRYMAEDPYLSPQGWRNVSTGPIFDRENILMVGRIADASIKVDPETQDTTFDVVSLGEEASSYENYPIVIEYDTVADDWIETPDLTVDRAMRYYVAWHTTLSLVADVYQTGDTHNIKAQDFLQGTIYQTLNSFLSDRLFARLLGDRFGRMFAEIDVQMQVYGSVGTLWVLESTDWLDVLDIRHYEVGRAKAAECGGLLYNAAGDVVPYLSRAPGSFDKYRGALRSSNSLAITDQDELNILSGRYLEYKNLEWEVSMSLAGNWRYCDIAPQRSVNVDIPTHRDDIQGRLIIREVTMDYAVDAGAIFTSISTELEETDGSPGVTVVIPDELPDIPPPPDGGPPPRHEPPGIEFEDLGRRIISCNKGVFVTDRFGDASPVWYEVNTGVVAGHEYCWKIFRDPWHWWTSGGSEKTLWGLFGDEGDVDIPKYVYKHESFPDGTWVEMLDADDLALPAVDRGILDIVATIEVEDLIMVAGAGQLEQVFKKVYYTESVDSGDNWAALVQVGLNANVDTTWPKVGFTIATSLHSAAQTVHVPRTVSGTQLDDYISADGGATFPTTRATNGTFNGIFHGRVLIPYGSVDGDDSYIYALVDTLDNSAGALQVSKDFGVTWTNISPWKNLDMRINAFAEFTWNREVLAVLVSNRPGVGNSFIYYTDDAGDTWTIWQTLGVHTVGWGALFEFNDDGTLSGVTYYDITNSRMMFATGDANTDKTGNLIVVSGGIDNVSGVERDTVGAA